MLPRVASAVLAIAALTCVPLAACGTSSGGGRAADAAAEASDDASDEAVVDSGRGGTQDVVNYPPTDAPQFGPDGCALLTVPCTMDAMCCSGMCIQGACGMMAHQAYQPYR